MATEPNAEGTPAEKKTFFAELKKTFSWVTIKEWLKRKVAILIVMAILLIFLKPSFALLHNLALIGLLATIWYLVADFGIFSITKLNFINSLIRDKNDAENNNWEMIAAAIVIAAIVLGAAEVVGNGWYLLQFNDVGIKPQ